MVEVRIRPGRDWPDEKDVLGRTELRVPGILAEWSFLLVLTRQNLALDHDLGLRRDLDIDGFALDQFDRLPEKRPRYLEFVNLHRYFGCGRYIDRRVHTDNDCDLQVAASRFAALQMLPDMPARMQARTELFWTLELEALIAQVTRTAVRGLADENARSNRTSGILLEVTTDRQASAIDLHTRPRDLLHSPRF